MAYGVVVSYSAGRLFQVLTLVVSPVLGLVSFLIGIALHGKTKVHSTHDIPQPAPVLPMAQVDDM